VIVLLAAVAAGEGKLRTQSFNADPHWDSLNNRLVPDPPPKVREDFGYSAERKVIGGHVQRSSIPAWYAKEIPVKTLNEKLTASGKFSVTASEGASGVCFGFFNHTSRGWRTPNSLVFRLDGNSNNYWVFAEYGTQHWQTGGLGCFEGERYQTTPTKPFPADGKSHTWKLSYDPAAAGGRGQLVFVLDGKSYSHDLAAGHKQDGANFDRFGIFNQQTTGTSIDAWFDDVEINGEKQDFSTDPKWEGKNNHGEFPDRVKRPMHDFGFSETNRAGGSKGEMGGIIWRGALPAYYGEKIKPVTFDDELHASGKIAFTAGSADSGAMIGFFNAESKSKAAEIPENQREPNILAIYIEGPSRIGHYFRPACFNSAADGAFCKEGPVIRPDGATHKWSFDYDPRGAGGNGQITFALDEDKRTFDLPAGVRKGGATLDHFGLFNGHSGGHYVELWFDDLQYTGSR
jgi:hypothetical protein